MAEPYFAERREGTILFCDIRNFTNLFEAEDPLKAVGFANTVLTRLGAEVEAVQGVVDRFTGDGFMAHFGLEAGGANHVDQACRAALRMRRALQTVNNQRYYNVEEVVSFGIGIHTGTVAYGEIKTEQISQLTVLGDVVNTAARIEGLTKYFAVDILLSNQSYHRVSDDYIFKKMPARELKGKKEQVETYWLLPLNE